jgi:F-type H+-transporting ATPase subunit gamma
MASLRDLRNRIKTVKSTQKITSAMKMVAGAKLKRAQDALASAKPYTENMHRIVMSLAHQRLTDEDHWIISGTHGIHLILVICPNKGLCGNYNQSIVRETKIVIKRLEKENVDFRLVFVGKKGFESLKKLYSLKTIKLGLEESDLAPHSYELACAYQQKIMGLFDQKFLGGLTIISGNFKNVLSQEPKQTQLVPMPLELIDEQPPYTICEPDAKELMPLLLTQYITTLLFTAMLESATCEHAARMTAMDNATRNANDMIEDLNLVYNRSRQAKITTELMEIISGAKALSA